MAGLPPDPNKKHPLLGVSSKPKKKEITYVFDLLIGESNEETYPEYSWKDLVSNEKAKQLNNERLASGKPVLDPFASDDEDNLKALAAKYEEKYANPTSKKNKRKRRAEDYIDRGAGYDENDSFIDNSDAYDEVVPADLETVRGGFYINSGSLDFREVEISDEEKDEEGPIESKENGKSHANNSTSSNNNKANGKRPSLSVSKKHQQTLSSKNSLSKSDKIRSSNKSGTTLSSTSTTNAVKNNTTNNSAANVTTTNLTSATSTTAVSDDADVPKKSSTDNESTSSGSSSESTSSGDVDSSSSSDSSSSEEEEHEEHVKNDVKPSKSQQQQIQVTATTLLSSLPPQQQQQPSGLKPNISNAITGPPPIKRLKTKNVPPNPNLAKNKTLYNDICSSINNNNNNNNISISSGINNNSGLKSSPQLVSSNSSNTASLINSSKDMIVSSSPNCLPTKLSSSSLQNPRPSQSQSPSSGISVISNLGISMPPGLMASNIKVPAPKSTPMGTSNSGLNLKSLSLPTKQKSKEISKQQKVSKSARSSLNDYNSLIQMQSIDLSNAALAAALAQHSQSNKKAKLQHHGDKQGGGSGLKTLSSASLSRRNNLPSLPKLKAKPKGHPQQQPLSFLDLPSSSLNLQNHVSSNVSLNQSLPSFNANSNRSSLSEPSQQTISSQRAEITKIKPSHLTSTTSSSPSTVHNMSINSSIKSLSNLGTGITVTEVKEKGSSGSHSQHSSPSSVVTKEGPRSRSPNVGNTMTHNSSRGLPQSITITPSSLLNLATTGGNNNNSSNNNTSNLLSASNNPSLNISNIINPVSMSRGNVFGLSTPLSSSSSNSGPNVKKSNSGGFSMNTILGNSHPNNNLIIADPSLMTTKMAFNLGQSSHKKPS